jgi:hypothetical protein
VNYWLCIGLAIVGIAGATAGIVRDNYRWFWGGAGLTILALLIPRLLRGRVPIPAPRRAKATAKGCRCLLGAEAGRGEQHKNLPASRKQKPFLREGVLAVGNWGRGRRVRTAQRG